MYICLFLHTVFIFCAEIFFRNAIFFPLIGPVRLRSLRAVAKLCLILQILDIFLFVKFVFIADLLIPSAGLVVMSKVAKNNPPPPHLKRKKLLNMHFLVNYFNIVVSVWVWYIPVMTRAVIFIPTPAAVKILG